jgi:S-adenosylmethionine:tRNA ribosyltransferase-isomerase
LTSDRPGLPIDRFDYDLPPELIAQHPVEPRDASRLLVVRRDSEVLEDRTFRDLPDLLDPGDLLILNDTRVMPARLFARRRTGGSVELLLLHRRPDSAWEALARPARRLKPGESLVLLTLDGVESQDEVEVIERLEGAVAIRFADEGAIERHGQVPLPPYIREWLGDAERYQTVYARHEGSAAAPTAGLHFTPELMERCRRLGLHFATITLHVGLDTFQPISTDDALRHQMHSERYLVPPDAIRAVLNARERGSRVVAVGTTSVRTLESAADAILSRMTGGSIGGDTSLYITPGYRFRIVDAMVTNFHLPRTTLMLLVSALAGEETIRRAYRHAVEQRYRFFSFGDAMLIV